MDDDKPNYIYLFVRQSISPAAQVAQVVHAALQCGRVFKTKAAESHVVVLGVPDIAALAAAMAHVTKFGVRVTPFVEPDLDYSLTSFATEPISGSVRDIFSQYKLLKL